jgi:5-hydroxyisourate hydrolase-like protein (transthyretin family)
MKKTFSLLTAMLLTILVYAQNKPGKISGTVLSPDKKPVESATVQLQRANDKALVKAAVTDKAGNYVFEKIAEGNYIISFAAAGFTKQVSDPISITAANPTVTIPSTELAVQAKSLEGVTVTATKPFIEQKLDRTIVMSMPRQPMPVPRRWKYWKNRRALV